MKRNVCGMTLKELAKSRGWPDCGIERRRTTRYDTANRWEAWTDGAGGDDERVGLRFMAPTRRAAEAGLRAALESLPERKVKP